jgi:hypothetical protein
MNADQHAGIVDFVLGRIPYADLIRKIGGDPLEQPDFILTTLNEARLTMNADDVDCTLVLAARLELLTANLAPVLAELLLQPWHHKHEDIARTLQNLCVPETADALASAALIKHEYLEYNDSQAFARKCVWALADIGTPQARAHLENLARGPHLEVVAYAQKRLDNWEGELKRKGGIRQRAAKQ